MRRDIQGPAVLKEAAAAKKDVYWKALLDATPAQAEQWVINNVDSLPKARTLLAKMVRYLVALEQRG